jgi:UDP-N-acetylmuramyl pentapeptide synthase
MKRLFAKILAWCARLYIRRTKPYIVWVTWSVGKTTCRLIVSQFLRQQLTDLRIDTSEKNFNSEIWLCFAILGIHTYRPTFAFTLRTLRKSFFIALGAPARAEVMVLEYGIDHPWDMDELLAIAVPDIAIFTGVDLVHAVYFPTPKDIFVEKVKLIDAARDVVFYGASLSSYIENHITNADMLSFAFHEDQNDTDIGFNAYVYWRVDEQIGSEFIVCQWEDRMTTIRTNLVGHEHAGYLSLAYEITQIVAVRNGVVSPSQTELDITIDLQPWRMSRLRGKWWSLLMDSSYNASPGSMRMMIHLITDLRQELFPDRQIVLCLGEMRELGEELSQQEHTRLASLIIHADQLFLIGEHMHKFLIPALHDLGYPLHRLHFFSHPVELGEALDTYLSQQDKLALVLFKGSQNTIFLEEAVKQVLRYPEDKAFLCRQDAWWLTKKK